MKGGGLHDVSDLMARRVREVLLVASPYDAFILEVDGQLDELVLSRSLEAAPTLTSVGSGAEALELLRGDPRFELVVATLHVGDLNAAQLARTLRDEGRKVPVVLLASDSRELSDFLARHGADGIDE